MGVFQAPELTPEQQRAIIMRLDRFGWTQEEVAQVVGVTHQRITQILQEIAELPKLAKNVLASGIPHLEVAERFNLPLQVVWAIDLAGRTADGGLVASRQIFESTWQRHLAARAIAESLAPATG